LPGLIDINIFTDSVKLKFEEIYILTKALEVFGYFHAIR